MTTQAEIDLKAADTLAAARDLMNDNGKHWVQQEYEIQMDDGRSGFCSVGALRAVVEFEDENFAHYTRALEALSDDPRIQDYNERTHGYSKGDIDFDDFVIYWNDAEERTWAEVSDAFAKAEARLRGAR